jgi:hypothetical protein
MATVGERLGSHYPTITSVLDAVESAVGDDFKSDGHRDRWTLGMSWDDALDAYRGGWAEGAKKAYDLAETIKLTPTATRQALKRSVVGGHPNVGAYLAGSPVNMWQVSRQDAKGRPFVHLYCQINYLARVDASTAFDRGCALVALADALETAGCRVKITGIDNTEALGGRSKGRMYCSTYGLKEYGERLDVDNIIFTLAHPAFYRRICFAIRTTHYGTCEGSTEQASDSEMEPTQVNNEHNVMFSHLTPPENGRNPEWFLAKMLRQLPEQVREWIEE